MVENVINNTEKLFQVIKMGKSVILQLCWQLVFDLGTFVKVC